MGWGGFLLRAVASVELTSESGSGTLAGEISSNATIPMPQGG